MPGMYFNADSQSTEAMFKGKSRSTRTKSIIIILLVIAVAFVIGLLIGRYAVCKDNDPTPQGHTQPLIDETIIREADPAIGDEIIRQINSDNIRNYLR